MTHSMIAVPKSARPISFPKGHNFVEGGEGLLICRECGAEVEQRDGYQLYTPGNGVCEE